MSNKHADRIRQSLEQAGGFEALNLNRPQYGTLAQAELDDALAVARNFALTFNTEAGQWVINHLIARLWLVPVVTDEATAYQVGIREGQNSILREIMALIEMAETGGHPND